MCNKRDIDQPVKIKKACQKTIKDATINIQRWEGERIQEMQGRKNEDKLTNIETTDLLKERRTIKKAVEEDTQAAAMRSRCERRGSRPI